jgi:hypothetical protein
VTRKYPAPVLRGVGHVRRYGIVSSERIASAGFGALGLFFETVAVSRFGMSPELIFFANRLVS